MYEEVSGDRYLNLGEQTLIIPQDVKTQWEKAKIDLVVLAKRRWRDGRTIKELTQNFGVSRTTVKRNLVNLKKSDTKGEE